jgi:isopropylmalate/homocitrate/citramalate synthase
VGWGGVLIGESFSGCWKCEGCADSLGSKGATGNVATEDLLHLVHSLGCETGIDMVKMAEIGRWITGEIGKANDSRAGKATLARLDL